MIDKSSLNFKRKKKLADFPIYFRNLHVIETMPHIINMVQEKGITIKSFGYQFHKNKLVEGALVQVYANDRTTNLLEKRDKNDVDEFIADKLHVIRENPDEIKDQKPGTKIVTEVNDDETADNAYNLEEGADGKVYGNL